MSIPIVNVDSAWLTAAGSPPYLLAAGKNFVLQVDVNVTTPGFSGEVFNFAGRNTQLTLNGHTVRVDGRPIRQKLDSDMGGWTSEATIRTDSTQPISNYNGVFWAGNFPDRITDPGTLGAYRLPPGNDLA